MSELEARIRRAWLGRVSGCQLGKAVEMLSMLEGYEALADYLGGVGCNPLRDYVEYRERQNVQRQCRRGFPKRSEPDDDLNYTLLSLLMLEAHGLDLTTTEVARAWLRLLPASCCRLVLRVGCESCTLVQRATGDGEGMTSQTGLKLAIEVGGSVHNDPAAITEWVQSAERLGVESVWSGEAWWGDAVTVLAYLAGQTKRIRLGTGIMQITARVPAMTAMTALSLNDLSGGRFILGLGASGPQVAEGLHGVAYESPLTRLRETVEICRMIFAGRKVQYDGKVFQLPRPGGEGKVMRIAHEPVDIPVYLATLAPKSLAYTGAAADGWLGTSFSPDHPDAHLSFIEAGATSAGRALADIDLCVSVRVEIGERVEEMIERRKPGVAFTLGGMGSATTNFYSDAFRRAGYEDDATAIQSLWIAGKREEAARRVPDAMITRFQAIGTRDMVRDRFQKYKDAGINTLKLGLDGVKFGAPRLELLENIVDLVEGLS